MLPIYTQYLLALIAIVIAYIIGGFVKSFVGPKTNKPFENIFINLFIGLTTIVFSYSILKTAGLTINIFIIIITILYLKINKLNISVPKIELKYSILLFSKRIVFVLPILALFILQEEWYFGEDNILNRVPHFDFLFYSNISSSLIQFGNENKDMALNYIFPETFDGITPYHYFELWLTSFYSVLFQQSTLLVLLFVIYPILKTTIFFGILLLIENHQSIRIHHFIISFLLLSISSIYMGFYGKFELTKYYIGYTQSGILSFFGHKYLPLYMVAILCLKNYSIKNFSNVLLLLLFAAIFSIGTAPAIFATIVTLSFLYARQTKSYTLFLMIIFFIVSFILFYKLNTLNTVSNYLNNVVLFKRIIANPKSVLLYKELLFSCIFPAVRLVLTLLPFVFFIFFVRIKTITISNFFSNKLIFFTILLSTYSIIASALNNGMLDSGQLLYNILPFINCVFIYIFVVLVTKMNRITMYALLFLSATLFLNINHSSQIKASPSDYNSYSENFKISCLHEVSQNNSYSIIGYSLGEDNYKLGSLMSCYKTPGFFLTWSKKGVSFFDLNSERISNITSDYSLAKFEMQMYRNKTLNKFCSKEELILRFIKEYKIKFFFVQNKSTLSTNFFKQLKIKRNYTDPYTNDRFYVLSIN